MEAMNRYLGLQHGVHEMQEQRLAIFADQQRVRGHRQNCTGRPSELLGGASKI